MHSKFSDGTEWPEAIVSRARDLGLEAIALTDHDSMEGVARFLQACQQHGLVGIAGVEIDCVAPEIGFNSEILGYFPAGHFQQVQDYLREILQQRLEKMALYLQKSRDFFQRQDLTLAELITLKLGLSAKEASTIRPGCSKPDLYNYLGQKGLLAPDISYAEFKAEFSHPGHILAGPDPKPNLAEICDRIRAAGGYSVLPHPAHIFRDNLDLLQQEKAHFRHILEYCRRIGVWGVEQYHYRANRAEINALVLQESHSFGFAVTYGSDCHGRGSSNDTMAKFWGDFAGFGQ
jgi:hypothetical protein